MSRLLRNASDEIKAWAGIKLGTVFCEPCSAIGILDKRNKLIGAAIFNNYQARSVSLTAYGPGAFRKDVCRELADYAFNALGCERVGLTVRADNIKVLQLVIKHGWKPEGRMERFYGDCDAIILGLLRSRCPFLED